MSDDKSRVEILRQTTYYMLHIGFQARQKGYRYLREAIWIAYQDPEKLTSVTKLLYPEVAKRFKTTGTQVERAIRSAIETVWIQGDKKTIREIFYEACMEEEERPTNTKFIVSLLRCIGGVGNGLD